MKSKDQRRTEAKARQKERKERTVTQQISKLDKLLGNGKGAIKERKRLTK